MDQTLSGKWEARLRQYIHRSYWLLRLVRAARHTWFLGPWNGLLVRHYRARTKNLSMQARPPSLFPALDVDEAVRSLESSGLAMGISLSSELLAEIIAHCGRRKRYINPHRTCQAVDQISRDFKIIEVAKRYLGVNPILYSSIVYWTRPQGAQSRSQPHRADYHYDSGDFRTLSVFIYLTDVHPDCGPHSVVIGTHKRKTIWQLMNPYLSADAALSRYGENVRILIGEKGTGFFEDLTCFHKHLAGDRLRGALVLRYCLRRRPES
jgi:hypothetical protein